MPDREKVIEALQYLISGDCCDTQFDYLDEIEAAIAMLKEQPEIVRCKDCVHWDKGHTEECDNLGSICFHNGWCEPDWFCADGERKDDDA